MTKNHHHRRARTTDNHHVIPANAGIPHLGSAHSVTATKSCAALLEPQNNSARLRPAISARWRLTPLVFTIDSPEANDLANKSAAMSDLPIDCLLAFPLQIRNRTNDPTERHRSDLLPPAQTHRIAGHDPLGTGRLGAPCKQSEEVVPVFESTSVLLWGVTVGR